MSDTKPIDKAKPEEAKASQITAVTLPAAAAYTSKAVEPGSDLSIHRRMLLVYEWVTHVMKNDVVSVSDEKSYNAVTHDDISAALHVPLARAGILYKYSLEKMTITEFETSKPGWNGGPPKVTKWYKAAVQVSVRFINVDKPDEFIEYAGESYAMDTSDKAPAKALSLALKVIDLKAFKLESRDHEEQREFEKKTEWDPKEYQGQNQSRQQSKPAANKFQPSGNKAAAPANKPADKAAPPTTPPPEDQAQRFPKDDVPAVQQGPRPNLNDPAEYIMPVGENGVKGTRLASLDESTLKKIKEWATGQLAISPPVANMTQVFEINQKVTAFLKSVGKA